MAVVGLVLAIIVVIQQTSNNLSVTVSNVVVTAHSTGTLLLCPPLGTSIDLNASFITLSNSTGLEDNYLCDIFPQGALSTPDTFILVGFIKTQTLRLLVNKVLLLNNLD